MNWLLNHPWVSIPLGLAALTAAAITAARRVSMEILTPYFFAIGAMAATIAR